MFRNLEWSIAKKKRKRKEEKREEKKEKRKVKRLLLMEGRKKGTKLEAQSVAGSANYEHSNCMSELHSGKRWYFWNDEQRKRGSTRKNVGGRGGCVGVYASHFEQLQKHVWVLLKKKKKEREKKKKEKEKAKEGAKNGGKESGKRREKRGNREKKRMKGKKKKKKNRGRKGDG